MSQESIFLLRSSLLLAASLASLLKILLTTKDKYWLVAYFSMQTLTNFALFPRITLFGRTFYPGLNSDMKGYAEMFTIFTFCILVASAGYALHCLKAMPKVLRGPTVVGSLILPTLLGVLTIGTSENEMPTYLVISFAEGCILLALGVLLATVAPVVRGPSLPLALLWLSLAAWEYAWTLCEPIYPIFWKLNEFLPTCLVLVASLWIVCQKKIPDSLKMQ